MNTQLNERFYLNVLKMNFIKLKNFYENLKVKSKLFLVFLSIILIICSVSLVSLQIVTKIYNQLLYNESAQFLNSSSLNIENEFKKIETLTYNFISDTEVQKYVLEIKNSEDKYDKFNKGKELINKLLNKTFSEKYIISTNYLDTNGEQYVQGVHTILLTEELRLLIISKSDEKEGKVVLIEADKGPNSLIMARQIRSVANLSLENLGTIFLGINMEKIIRDYSKTLLNDNYFMIFTKDGKQYSSKYLEGLEFNSLNFEDDSGYQFINIKGRKYFYTYKTSGYAGFMYVNIIPYQQIFKKIILIRFIMILIFIALFIITVFISLIFSKNLLKPIESLALKMQTIEKKSFEVENIEFQSTFRKDEIGQLEREFEIMIKKINSLIKENYTKQLHVKEAQYKALQAQINPHFLYNTLDSINWLAKVNKQKEISLVVESLGNLLRSSISRKEHIIPINEEIGILNNYINIQKFRYEERLEFLIDIDEKIRNFKIPKLTLQPIVENSINYALEKMLGTCIIEVRSKTTADLIQLIVKDNGPGMESEFLLKLKNGEIKPNGLGIGLKNIDDRIKSIFGQKYGLNIESNINSGTEVCITIPKGTVNGNV